MCFHESDWRFSWLKWLIEVPHDTEHMSGMLKSMRLLLCLPHSALVMEKGHPNPAFCMSVKEKHFIKHSRGPCLARGEIKFGSPACHSFPSQELSVTLQGCASCSTVILTLEADTLSFVPIRDLFIRSRQTLCLRVCVYSLTEMLFLCVVSD